MTESNAERECINHKEPHGVDNKPENKLRLWVCEECPAIFGDTEIRSDQMVANFDKKWGHECKAKKYRAETRCESHLIPYIPEEL